MAFKWSAGKLSQIVKILGDFIRANRRKSRAKPNYRWGAPPLWSLSLTTKIILIFATRKDSPNFVHCLLMAFSDLLKKKHKNFLEKHYAGARQRWAKTLWSHLKRINWYIKMKPFGKYVFWFSFPVCLMMYWNREEWLYNITLEGKRLSIFYFSRRSMHPKPLPKWRVMFESRIHV